jgi:hypothetical protein
MRLSLLLLLEKVVGSTVRLPCGKVAVGSQDLMKSVRERRAEKQALGTDFLCI